MLLFFINMYFVSGLVFHPARTQIWIKQNSSTYLHQPPQIFSPLEVICDVKCNFCNAHLLLFRWVYKQFVRKRKGSERWTRRESGGTVARLNIRDQTHQPGGRISCLALRLQHVTSESELSFKSPFHCKRPKLCYILFVFLWLSTDCSWCRPLSSHCEVLSQDCVQLLSVITRELRGKQGRVNRTVISPKSCYSMCLYECKYTAKSKMPPFDFQQATWRHFLVWI